MNNYHQPTVIIDRQRALQSRGSNNGMPRKINAHLVSLPAQYDDSFQKYSQHIHSKIGVNFSDLNDNRNNSNNHDKLSTNNTTNGLDLQNGYHAYSGDENDITNYSKFAVARTNYNNNNNLNVIVDEAQTINYSNDSSKIITTPAFEPYDILAGRRRALDMARKTFLNNSANDENESKLRNERIYHDQHYRQPQYQVRENRRLCPKRHSDSHRKRRASYLYATSAIVTASQNGSNNCSTNNRHSSPIKNKFPLVKARGPPTGLDDVDYNHLQCRTKNSIASGPPPARDLNSHFSSSVKNYTKIVDNSIISNQGTDNVNNTSQNNNNHHDYGNDITNHQSSKPAIVTHKEASIVNGYSGKELVSTEPIKAAINTRSITLTNGRTHAHKVVSHHGKLNNHSTTSHMVNYPDKIGHYATAAGEEFRVFHKATDGALLRAKGKKLTRAPKLVSATSNPDNHCFVDNHDSLKKLHGCSRFDEILSPNDYRSKLSDLDVKQRKQFRSQLSLLPPHIKLTLIEDLNGIHSQKLSTLQLNNDDTPSGGRQGRRPLKTRLTEPLLVATKATTNFWESCEKELDHSFPALAQFDKINEQNFITSNPPSNEIIPVTKLPIDYIGLDGYRNQKEEEEELYERKRKKSQSLLLLCDRHQDINTPNKVPTSIKHENFLQNALQTLPDPHLTSKNIDYASQVSEQGTDIGSYQPCHVANDSGHLLPPAITPYTKICITKSKANHYHLSSLKARSNEDIDRITPKSNNTHSTNTCCKNKSHHAHSGDLLSIEGIDTARNIKSDINNNNNNNSTNDSNSSMNWPIIKPGSKMVRALRQRFSGLMNSSPLASQKSIDNSNIYSVVNPTARHQQPTPTCKSSNIFRALTTSSSHSHSKNIEGTTTFIGSSPSKNRNSKATGNLNKTPGQTKNFSHTFDQYLEDAYPSDYNPLIPSIVYHCVKIIESYGVKNLGIYRVPGNNNVLSELVKYLDAHHKCSYEALWSDRTKWRDVNVVASILKTYFRRLKNPLLTKEFYHSIIESNRLAISNERLLTLKKFIHILPVHHYHTLKFLMAHLYKVTLFADQNRMNSQNLAIIFGPTLIRLSDNSTALNGTTAKTNGLTKSNTSPKNGNGTKTRTLKHSSAPNAFGSTNANSTDIDVITLVRDMPDQCQIVEALINNYPWFFENISPPIKDFLFIEEPEKLFQNSDRQIVALNQQLNVMSKKEEAKETYLMKREQTLKHTTKNISALPPSNYDSNTHLYNINEGSMLEDDYIRYDVPTTPFCSTAHTKAPSKNVSDTNLMATKPMPHLPPIINKRGQTSNSHQNFQDMLNVNDYHQPTHQYSPIIHDILDNNHVNFLLSKTTPSRTCGNNLSITKPLVVYNMAATYRPADGLTEKIIVSRGNTTLNCFDNHNNYEDDSGIGTLSYRGTGANTDDHWSEENTNGTHQLPNSVTSTVRQGLYSLTHEELKKPLTKNTQNFKKSNAADANALCCEDLCFARETAEGSSSREADVSGEDSGNGGLPHDKITQIKIDLAFPKETTPKRHATLLKCHYDYWQPAFWAPNTQESNNTKIYTLDAKLTMQTKRNLARPRQFYPRDDSSDQSPPLYHRDVYKTTDHKSFKCVSVRRRNSTNSTNLVAYGLKYQPLENVVGDPKFKFSTAHFLKEDTQTNLDHQNIGQNVKALGDNNKKNSIAVKRKRAVRRRHTVIGTGGACPIKKDHPNNVSKDDKDSITNLENRHYKKHIYISSLYHLPINFSPTLDSSNCFSPYNNNTSSYVESAV